MNQVLLNLDRYWQAVQQRICTKCIDGDAHGNCRLTGEESCGLKAHFPRIVETIHSVKSDKMEPYIDALRQNVCANCKHQPPNGKCMVRANVDCGLDRYFPLVVEAIEAVQGRTVLDALN